MAVSQAHTISLEALLPKGIRVRKGVRSVSLIVQTRKQVTDNGIKKIIPDRRTVKLDLPKEYNSEQYRGAFLEALEEAKKEKVLANFKKLQMKLHPDLNKDIDSTKISQMLTEAKDLIIKTDFS